MTGLEIGAAAAGGFLAGTWVGMRLMGRNLHRVLAGFTPEQLRELARRTRRARSS